MLLAEGGYAPANLPEWIGKLHPGDVLLSVAGATGTGDPASLAGLHRATDRPERLDRAEHGWGADVGGGEVRFTRKAVKYA